LNEYKEALEIVEEYLDEVRKYLPIESADDIIEELRTHIIDKANEMGGLTVKNAYRIIRELGEPRELASKYVIGGEKRKLRFELGISEDIYPYFIQLVFWLTLIIVIGYTVRILRYVYSAEGLVSIAIIFFAFVDMIVSMLLTILFLYIFMSFISSNPDLKEMFYKFLRDIFGPVKTERKQRKEKIVKIEKKIEKIKEQVSKITSTSVSAVLNLFGGMIAFIAAYVIYIYGFRLPFNWLMQLLIYMMILYLLIRGSLNLANYIYISYTERRSYSFNVVKSMVSLIFVPWFVLANIFTEEIQILILDPLIFKNSDYQNLLNYIKIILLPSDYIFLAKLLTLLILIIIIVDAVIILLKYTRTTPKKE